MPRRPGFWRMHGLDKAPEGQAQRDLHEAEKTPGRTIMGVTRRVVEDNPESGHEIIGIVDFRLNWPEETTAYLGILLIAEPVQRQGFGTQALDLLQPWLASAAGIERMRLGVEQYNTNALLFFQRMGFYPNRRNQSRSGWRSMGAPASSWRRISAQISSRAGHWKTKTQI